MHIKRGEIGSAKEAEAASDIKAGQVVSHDLDKQNKLVPALANGQLWRFAGIATHDCKAGELVTVAYDGSVEFPEGTFEAGFIYVLSDKHAGKLIKHDEMGTTGYLAFVGYSVSDKVLELVHLQRRVVAFRELQPVKAVVEAVKGKG